jgi:hypothetical protein
MKRLLPLLAAATIAGCATSPALPPGTMVAEAKLAQQPVQEGVTTRAQLLALLGPTTSIRFANGVEVWRYMLPPAAGQGSTYGEYVVVIDAQGIITKTRRAPVVYQIPGAKQ